MYYDSVGKNFNDLKRDESFRVVVKDSMNEIVPLRKSSPDQITVISRRVGYKEVLKGDSLIYRHDIRQWVTLKEPGKYIIECSKEFQVKKRRRKVNLINASCSTSFDVMVADSNLILKKLDDLWLRIQNEKNDYSERTHLMSMFYKNESVAIIPYLKTVIDSSTKFSDLNQAITGLSKFKDNEEAFHILSKVIEYDPERFRKFVTREDLLPSMMDNIQGRVIKCLMEFNDDSLVLPYLRKHENHQQDRVRLFIIQELEERKK